MRCPWFGEEVHAVNLLSVFEPRTKLMYGTKGDRDTLYGRPSLWELGKLGLDSGVDSRLYPGHGYESRRDSGGEDRRCRQGDRMQM